MVVALGPGKFYGSSLPRPRFYTDVKFNDERVDPPAPVLDPFLSWANEAHWSMGGLNFKRLRLQGRIEGNIKRLRAQREKYQKKKKSQLVDSPSPIVDRSIDDSSSNVPSPPPAPIANKRRRRLVAVIEEDEEQEIENIVDVISTKKRVLARKLDDEFDRVATDGHLEKSHTKRPSLDLNTVPKRTRIRRSMVENVQDAKVTRSSSSSPATRSSPRFLKRGLA